MDEVKTGAAKDAKISEEYLADMRDRVRISTARPKTDKELRDLILAARADLVRVGILPERAKDEVDPLIKQAISTYIKAEFGLENEDAEKYRASYQMQRAEISFDTAYTTPREG